MRTIPVDIDFLEQVEFDLSLRGKTDNVFRVAGLLSRELVARERQDTETCIKKMGLNTPV